MPKNRLGIDLGSSSLGWCLYSLRNTKNKNGRSIIEIDNIVDAGVRIFSDSRSREQGKQHIPLNVARRDARMMSRRRDRYLQRRDALMRYLIRYGLMPEDRAERKELEKLNPYELRAWAVTDSESPYPQFEPQYLVGRAIFHLNQRRGFKSNRKTEKKESDTAPGAIESSTTEFREKIKATGCQTAGECLWKSRRGKFARAKPEEYKGTGANRKIALYNNYADRALIADEFDTIWKKQAKIHPQIFTPELGGRNSRDNGRRDGVIREIIFHQRELAPAVIGRCTFYPEEYRARRSLPSYQRFRILQEVNNLRFRSGNAKKKLPEEARKEIIDRLLKWRDLSDMKDGLLHFEKMKEIVEAQGIVVTSIFATASARRPGLFGDKTSHILRGIVGEKWDEWSLEKRDDLVELILNPSKKDKEVNNEIVKTHELDSEQSQKCVKADTRLNSDHGELSLRAVREISTYLEKRLIYNEAVEAAGLGSHSDRRTEFDGSMQLLPRYQDVLPQYCNPLRKRDEDNPKMHRISNPTVHVGLNQLRLVVNDIIRIHGKPTEIVVELAREFGMGKIGKEDYDFLQSRLQSENTRRRERIEDLELPANTGNMLKLRLWEELNENELHRCCVYTGKRINITNLFSNEIDIEHILPFSKTGDNSTANKTLCYHGANHGKGDKTPFEAFGKKPDYEEIINRAKQFTPDPALEAIHRRRGKRKGKSKLTYENRKWRRFLPDAKEKFLGEHDDFTERYLNETQFLSRAAKQYLEAICPRNNIWVIHGGLTALIRRGMGLDTILNDDELTRAKREEIDRALDNKAISKEEAKRQKGDLYRGKNRNDHRHHAIDAAVIGATSRSLLQKLSTEAAKMEEEIHSTRFAKIVRGAIEKSGIEPDSFHRDIAEVINNIIVSHKPQRGREGPLHKDTAYRIQEDETGREFIRIGKRVLSNFVPVKDHNGKHYKAYESGSNWACEIYQTKDNKWSGEVITTFNANQQATNKNGKTYYKFVPRWRRQNPTAQLIMRLHSGDILVFEQAGEKRIVRVQKIDTLNRIYFAEHTEVNAANRADARIKLSETMKKWDSAKCEEFRVLLEEKTSATAHDILTPRDGEWEAQPRTSGCMSLCLGQNGI